MMNVFQNESKHECIFSKLLQHDVPLDAPFDVPAFAKKIFDLMTLE